MDRLLTDIPAIKLVYDACEAAGYRQDKILETFQSMDIIAQLQPAHSSITYASVGQELADMDVQRGSWTNEDPNWQALASVLDVMHGVHPKTSVC